LGADTFVEPLEGNEPYVAKVKIRGGACVFLEGNACKVYPFRPLVCRFFPFWLEKDKSLFVFRVGGECPGLGVGNILGYGFFSSLLRLALQKHGEALPMLHSDHYTV
jgi:Fe-S-cluster containining protein